MRVAPENIEQGWEKWDSNNLRNDKIKSRAIVLRCSDEAYNLTLTLDRFIYNSNEAAQQCWPLL